MQRASLVRCLAFLGALASSVATVGCGDEPVDGPLPRASSRASGARPSVPEGRALVRVVLAAADASDVPETRIWVDRTGRSLGTSLMLGDTTDYVEVEPGAHEIVFDTDGNRATAHLDVRAGQRITAIAAGRLSSHDDSDRLRLIALEEHFEAVAEGTAVVRVVNAAADAPAFGIDVGDDDPAHPELSPVERWAASAEAGLALRADAPAQLAIVQNGSRATAFTAPTLESKGEYFVVALGEEARRPSDFRAFSLLTVGSNGTIARTLQNPVVRVFHASPDAPALTAFAGDRKLVDTLSFGDLGASVQLPPGSYSVDLFAKNGTAEPPPKPFASVSTGLVRAGETYLTVLTGFAAPERREPGLSLVSFADAFDLADQDAARMRFVNATADVPSLDFGTVQKRRIDQIVLRDLPFGTASAPAGAHLAPQSLTLGVSPDASSGSTPAASFETRIEAPARGFLVGAGVLDEGRGKGVRVFRIDVDKDVWTSAPLPQIRAAAE
jgi:hypothetical protein